MSAVILGRPGLLVGSPPVAASESIGLGEWFRKPTVADARDDEFESTDPLAAYGLYNIASGTAMAPGTKTKAALLYGNPAPGTIRYQSHTDRRPSFLSLQLGSDALLLKPVTMAANDSVWSRMSAPIYTSTGGGAASFQMVLMASTAGHPDPANQLRIGFVGLNDGSYSVRVTSVVAGATANIPFSESPTLVGGIFEYYFLDRQTTSTWRAYTLWHGYRRRWADAAPIGFTIAYAGWQIEGNPSYSGHIWEIDFLRFNAAGYLGAPV